MSLQLKLNSYMKEKSIPHVKALGIHLGVSQTTMHRIMSCGESTWSVKIQAAIMAKVHTVVAADFAVKKKDEAKEFTNADARRIMKEKPLVLHRLEELQELYL